MESICNLPELDKERNHHKTVLGCILCKVVPAVVGFGLLCAGIYVKARHPDNPAPAPAPSGPAAGTPAPTGTGKGRSDVTLTGSSGIGNAGTYVTVIHRAGQARMNLHESPSSQVRNVDGDVLRGSRVRVLGEACSAQGYVWYAIACTTGVRCRLPAAHYFLSSLQTDAPKTCDDRP
jgi:hypothetical protein